MQKEDLRQVWRMFLEHVGRSDDVSGETVELLSKSSVSKFDEIKGFIEISPEDEMGYHYLKNNLGNSVSAVLEYFSNFHGIENIEIKNPAPNGTSGRPSQNSAFTASPEGGKKDVFIGSLNTRYTFESFVVGESNNFAHAAALGSIKNPGRHNPLFIRGASGLGKTHLMNAMGNRLLEKKPEPKICCLSAEEFTNTVVEYISRKNMESLRKKLRERCDILMIDDIQFIEGKRSTLEEFLHTFNALYDAGKQIVLTSDKVPDQMQKFEKRIISRFMWGLIVDIRPPDIETRVAIIKKKAEERKVEIPQGVVDMISEKVNNNVRELEGALIKLVVFAEAAGRPIDIRTAHEVFNSGGEAAKNPAGRTKGGMSAELIKATAEGFFNLKKGQIESQERTRTVNLARQVAMYLIRKLLDMPYVSIGEEFGGRDHSTVMHAVSKIENGIEQKEEVVLTAIKEVEDRMRYR